jgi:hypothetical protein
VPETRSDTVIQSMVWIMEEEHVNNVLNGIQQPHIQQQDETIELDDSANPNSQ